VLLRTFLIKIVTKLDSSGFDDAELEAKKLGAASKEAKRDLGALAKSADKAGDEIKETGQQAKAAATKIKRVGAEAEKSGGRLAGMKDKFSSAMGGMSAALASAGIAAALVVVGKAISFVSDETARLDAVSKGAQKSGLGVAQYQELDHIAVLSGASIGNLDKGITKLNVELAKGKPGPFADALREIGLSSKELKGLGATEQLAVLSGAMAHVTDEAERSRLAFMLMGKDGKELVPLLNSGREAIDAMADSAGRIFTKDELARAEAYQDALANLKNAIADITGGIALEVAPFLTEITDAARHSLPVLEQLKNLYEALKPALQELSKIGKDVFDEMGPPLARVYAAVGDVLEILGKLAGDGVGKLAGPIMAAVSAIAFLVDSLAFWLELAVKVFSVVENILGALEERWPRAFAAAAAVVDVLTSPLETAKTVVSAIFDFIEDSVGSLGGLTTVIRDIKRELGIGDAIGKSGIGGAVAGLRGRAGAAVEGAAAGRRDAADRAAQDADRQAQLDAQAAEQARVEGGAPKARKGGGGKRRKPLVDFGAEAKSAARSQATDFARAELKRLLADGLGLDEAQAAANRAGEAKAKELEARFREAGKVFEAATSPLLDSLGLVETGSMLEGRPAPEQLTITIAPVIKMIEQLTITVSGAAGPEQAAQLRTVAEQAKDHLAARVGDVAATVDNMFRLRARALVASQGGGRSLPGVV
jgi:hypothetical protein